MRYDHILAAFYATPLAMQPEKIEAIRHFLHRKAAGDDIEAEEVAAVVASRRYDGVQMIGRVAVLPVMGAISQRVGMVERASGGVSTEEIGATLGSLVDDKQVKAVVMAFDSPGGSVYGVQELGDKIRGYRDQKKIVGIADSIAASAAYWLVSQTSELNVTPGGQVGSIGVFSAHEDLSGYYEQAGIKTTLISAGDYKTEGSPFGPLTEDARSEIQAKVNHYYGAFIAAVAKGRGTTEARVRSDFGKGRMVTAQDAVSRGMADRVATIDQVLRRLGAYDSPASSPAASEVVTPLSARLAALRARSVEVQENLGK